MHLLPTHHPACQSATNGVFPAKRLLVGMGGRVTMKGPPVPLGDLGASQRYEHKSQYNYRRGHVRT